MDREYSHSPGLDLFHLGNADLLSARAVGLGSAEWKWVYSETRGLGTNQACKALCSCFIILSLPWPCVDELSERRTLSGNDSPIALCWSHTEEGFTTERAEVVRWEALQKLSVQNPSTDKRTLPLPVLGKGYNALASTSSSQTRNSHL